jgi:hypothetical protein
MNIGVPQAGDISASLLTCEQLTALTEENTFSNASLYYFSWLFNDVVSRRYSVGTHFPVAHLPNVGLASFVLMKS